MDGIMSLKDWPQNKELYQKEEKFNRKGFSFSSQGTNTQIVSQYCTYSVIGSHVSLRPSLSVSRLVSLSVTFSLENGKLHFNAPIGELVLQCPCTLKLVD